MKKNNLFQGVVFIVLGIACLASALLINSTWSSLLFGFAGAGILPGSIMIIKYIYWTSPKNKGKYAERMEQETIELHDERKQKLRDKSGRYAYILGIVVVCLSVIVIALLERFGIILNIRFMLIYLFGYLVFQLLAGLFIFRYLGSKY